MIKGKIIVGLILSNAILFLILWTYKEKFESKKIEASDYSALLKEEKEARFRDSKGLEHLRKEVEAIGNSRSLSKDPEWNKLIEEVKGLKAKHVLSASKVSISSEHYINTTIKDSIRFKDSVLIKCIVPYKDEFVSLSGCEGAFRIETKDSISQVIYQGKRTKRFLFIRYGPRSVDSELINYNPNSKINYHRSVILQKRK